MMDQKTLIFLPSYNESGHVQEMFKRIKAANIQADILFIDDNSPDGTGKILDELAEKNPEVSVVHRSGKAGIGSAHQEGIRRAYEHHYEILITMDCDLSHSPEYFPEFLKHSSDYDVVIGSRFMSEGGYKGDSLFRRKLTGFAHFLTNSVLGVPYDTGNAFRLYRLDKIPQGVFALISSTSYSFFFESLFVLHLNRFKIKEFPIFMPPRITGDSKMNLKEVWKSSTKLISIYFKSLINRKNFLYPGPA